MVSSILPESSVPPNGDGTHPVEDHDKNSFPLQFEKIEGGYEVLDGTGDVFTITRQSGKITCDCPAFTESRIGSCRHIDDLMTSFLRMDHDVNPDLVRTLPTMAKDSRVAILEYPFREDQIRIRNGVPKVDELAVIQRLNDGFGPRGWSFRIIEKSIHQQEELIVRGRISLPGNIREIEREGFGSYRFRPGEPIGLAEAWKHAVNDCICHCAQQFGIGLDAHTKNLSHLSFQPEVPVEM